MCEATWGVDTAAPIGEFTHVMYEQKSHDICGAGLMVLAVPGVLTTTDVDEATQGVEVAVMVGGFPRKAGMERKDVMAKNVSIYKSQASSLEKNAAQGVKVSALQELCHAHCHSHRAPSCV